MTMLYINSKNLTADCDNTQHSPELLICWSQKKIIQYTEWSTNMSRTERQGVNVAGQQEGSWWTWTHKWRRNFRMNSPRSVECMEQTSRIWPSSQHLTSQVHSSLKHTSRVVTIVTICLLMQGSLYEMRYILIKLRLCSHGKIMSGALTTFNYQDGWM